MVNPLLRSIAAISPTARGHAVTLRYLSKIPEHVTNVLTDDEIESYHLEIRLYQDSNKLPNPLDEEGNEVRVDHWWNAVFKLGEFPALSKLVLSVLTCFHSPQVESNERCH